MQQVLEDTIIVSQPTISGTVFQVSLLLARLLNQIINMPFSPNVIQENQRLFKDIGRDNIGLPGIERSIDCTHVRLVGTRFHNIKEVYRYRKGYFSLNVQVCVYINIQL